MQYLQVLKSTLEHGELTQTHLHTTMSHKSPRCIKFDISNSKFPILSTCPPNFSTVLQSFLNSLHHSSGQKPLNLGNVITELQRNERSAFSLEHPKAHVEFTVEDMKLRMDVKIEQAEMYYELPSNIAYYALIAGVVSHFIRISAKELQIEIENSYLETIKE